MPYKLNNITFSYGKEIIFKDFFLELPEKGIVCFFGPSGCGKTTLARIIAGLEKPKKGFLAGFADKNFSIVFQEDRLLPWYSCKKNMNLVTHKSEDIFCYLDMVFLGGEADKMIDELSGGMQRRLALARALAFNGDIFILDEPFKGLDMDLKNKIIENIKLFCKDKLVILITHDEDEASIADMRIDIKKASDL